MVWSESHNAGLKPLENGKGKKLHFLFKKGGGFYRQKKKRGAVISASSRESRVFRKTKEQNMKDTGVVGEGGPF